jgi:ethanolamine utilization protein EutA
MAEGRVFFSSTGRTLTLEDEIRLLSVGVDIGSSTSHLAFSRLTLERLDSRYVVSARELLFQSEILLTPYAGEETIDAAALGGFIARQYERANLTREAIDTGALILTGVAVRRTNARAIGELFAREAGRMVAVSAGDGLETTMAAYGSGAVARSIREKGRILNADVGGGTAKLALCEGGKIVALTALDVGARLVVLEDGHVLRAEEAGRRFAADLGISVAPGAAFGQHEGHRMAERMADALFAAIDGGAPAAHGTALLRLDPLPAGSIDAVSFSGGVAEYVYGEETLGYGDLGPALAAAIRTRLVARQDRVRLLNPAERIRATVIGAAQYTMQVSGGTIFVAPLSVLPLRSLPVAAPEFAAELRAEEVAQAVRRALLRHDLADGERPVALFAPWRGSATWERIDAFCRGVVEGLAPVLARGHPLVLAGDGDVGGLLGIHCREELGLENAVVSIDGIELKAFDYIDIGAMIPASGAVPVVIKSLVFPGAAG